MRVVAAADRLGYRANLAARTLASRSGPVGIVLTSLSDPLFVNVARAVASALVERRVRNFVTWDPDAGLAPPGPGGRTVSALVWVGGQAAREGLSEAIPCVVISDTTGEGDGLIELGRARGLALACRYLENEGHRRLAAVAAPGMLGAPRFVYALNGASVVLDAVGTGLAGVDAAIRAVQGREPATAIVCDSDVAALAVLRGCAAEGISVPDQASVVGLGDEPFARHSVPALTTVRVSVEQIAATTVEAILDLASGRRPSLEAPPMGKLVLRESSGPPP